MLRKDLINKLPGISIFISCLIVFTMLTLFLDTIKYPGFVGKHFFIDAKFFSTVCVVLILISKTKSSFIKWISKMSFLIFIISGLAYIYFIFAEALHHTNYVLSVYHFSLDGLIYIPLFSMLVFVASKIGKIRRSILKGKNFLQVIIFIFVAYTLYVNFGISLKTASVSDIYDFMHLKDSYDQKMYYQWGNYYNFMLFVKNNTPESANIVIPPQVAPWWNRSGNLLLVRYFLFPRNLIQYDTEEIPIVESLPEGTYIMVAWGEWGCEREGVCRGWPVESIKVREFIIKDSESSDVKEIRQNILYDPADTSNPFGLLKL